MQYYHTLKACTLVCVKTTTDTCHTHLARLKIQSKLHLPRYKLNPRIEFELLVPWGAPRVCYPHMAMQVIHLI